METKLNKVQCCFCQSKVDLQENLTKCNTCPMMLCVDCTYRCINCKIIICMDCTEFDACKHDCEPCFFDEENKYCHNCYEERFKDTKIYKTLMKENEALKTKIEELEAITGGYTAIHNCCETLGIGYFKTEKEVKDDYYEVI